MEKSAKYSKRRTIFIIVACLATAISTQPAPGFLGIGGKKPTPEPTPAPTPAATPAKTAEKPKTTPTPKTKAKSAPESTPTPTATPTPTPSPEKAKNKTKTSPKEASSPIPSTSPSPAPTKKKTPAKPAEKPAAETSNKLDDTGLLKPADLGGTDLVPPSDVLPPPNESTPTPTPDTTKTETTKAPETPASDSSTAGAQGADLPADLDLIPLPIDVDGDAQLLDLPMNEGLLPSGDIPPLNAPTATLGVPTAESERVLSTRYKALLTKTEKDPRLVALWSTAEKAKTYEQSRAAKREYYRQLFAMMRKADKTLTKRIDAMERAYLERLSQTRIEPTIPLGPPPKIEPLQ